MKITECFYYSTPMCVHEDDLSYYIIKCHIKRPHVTYKYMCVLEMLVFHANFFYRNLHR